MSVAGHEETVGNDDVPVRTDFRAGHVPVAVVADAVHRARRGYRRWRGRGHCRGGHGGRTAAAGRCGQTGGTPAAAAASAAVSIRGADSKRGQAAPPALLPGGGMGLGGGHVRVHGALAQSWHATVVRSAREGCGEKVSGRKLFQDRSVTAGYDNNTGYHTAILLI